MVHVLVVLLHACFSVVGPIPFLLAAIFFSVHPYIGSTTVLPDYRRTSDRSNFAWRRTARGHTAHAHRCVKLKQGQSILNKVRKAMQAKSKR